MDTLYLVALVNRIDTLYASGEQLATASQNLIAIRQYVDQHGRTPELEALVGNEILGNVLGITTVIATTILDVLEWAIGLIPKLGELLVRMVAALMGDYRKRIATARSMLTDPSIKYPISVLGLGNAVNLNSLNMLDKYIALKLKEAAGAATAPEGKELNAMVDPKYNGSDRDIALWWEDDLKSVGDEVTFNSSQDVEKWLNAIEAAGKAFVNMRKEISDRLGGILDIFKQTAGGLRYLVTNNIPFENGLKGSGRLILNSTTDMRIHFMMRVYRIVTYFIPMKLQLLLGRLLAAMSKAKGA